VNYKQYIEENTIRCEASYRGGGIEISLSEILGSEENFRMTAYQNYLGGGMLGAIAHSYNFNTTKLSKADQAIIEKVTQELKKYFHNLTNHEDNEWESASFEENQARPVSAY
jgi:hypothetical protein